jgi:surface antigen
MTLNYISDDSEMLYPGQELFINVTEQRAYDIWLLEKAQPILPKDEVVKPIVKKKQTTTKTTTTKTNNNWWTTTTTTQVTTPSWNSRILKQWYYNPKISNWFAVGYCTWYAAIKSPNIFKYISATKQDRPFGGNAVNWYSNAKAAWFSVGQSPRPGAIVVYKNLRSSAWHVGIVLSVNSAAWEMTIEDMNYAGRFIVTQRIDNINNPKIVGYIYQ